MTELSTELRKDLLRGMLKTLAHSDGEHDRAPEARADLLPDTGHPVYDEMKFRLRNDAERASLGIVAAAMVEHQTRMAKLGRGESYADPSSEAAPVHANTNTTSRTAIDLWVMVFSDDDCTKHTGEALHRRTLVDAVPRTGEYFVPGQLKGFTTLMPVVHHVEHAPFPENSDEPTVLVVIHVAAVAESDKSRRQRQSELRAEGWKTTVPQPI